jgi:tetratricopeptide (TPR) repeat protein
MGQLNALESAGLINLAQLEPDVEYLFRHPLVHEAVYGSLLTADQRRLHRAVGEAVERLYPERVASRELSATLARHFGRAQDDARAHKYSILAAEAALESYANQEAETQYRSALQLSCCESERAALLAGLGEALFRQGRYAEAIRAWQEGVELYQAAGDTDNVARLYARAGRAAWYSGDRAEGLRLCKEGLEVVAGAPEGVGLAMLVHEAGRAYFFNDMADKAEPLCRQALDMADRLGAVKVQADALATLGVLPDRSSEDALADLTRAVELSESAGELEIAVRANHNLGAVTEGMLGDARAATEHFLRAAELARRRGTAREELLSRLVAAEYSLEQGNLAAVKEALPLLESLQREVPDPISTKCDLRGIRAALLEYRGDWAPALEIRRGYVSDARLRGMQEQQLYAATSLAWTLLELDRLGPQAGGALVESPLAEAGALLDEMLTLEKAAHEDWLWMRCQMSIVRARQGRVDEARHFLGEAREHPRRHKRFTNEAIEALTEAELLASEQRWSDALEMYDAAATLTGKMGLRWWWARILRDWADVHLARGEPTDLERAQALLRESRSACAEMGSPYYAALLEERLQSVRTKSLAQAVTLGKAVQQLEVAGRIQEGLLPAESPYIPGWQLAATLLPANETSGDFYDFIPLPGRRWGIVVADVADKGAGAALYMALSRTLIRSFAAEHVLEPERALAAANARILNDTHTDMFVTVFYGVLDPEEGSFVYCNAGHNPPLLLEALEAGRPRALIRTGMPLGILDDAKWEQSTAQIEPGDALVLYSDGVTEAQGVEEVVFGQKRLLDVLEESLGSPAQVVQEAVLAEIQEFVGEAPQFDDVTLVVVTRL